MTGIKRSWYEYNQARVWVNHQEPGTPGRCTSKALRAKNLGLRIILISLAAIHGQIPVIKQNCRVERAGYCNTQNFFSQSYHYVLECAEEQSVSHPNGAGRQ